MDRCTGVCGYWKLKDVLSEELCLLQEVDSKVPKGEAEWQWGSFEEACLYWTQLEIVTTQNVQADKGLAGVPPQECTAFLFGYMRS